MGHGDRHTLMHGITHGRIRGQWSKDAASGKGVPASAAEWANVMAAANITSGSPSLLWLCGEASGNLNDTIGTFVGTASGTGITYNSAVSGWSRTGINFTDGGSGTFTNTDAGLPDLSTTSILVLGYVIHNSTPALTRSCITLGTTVADSEITSGPVYRTVSGANNVQGVSNPTGSVRPIFLRYNRTAGNQVHYSTLDKLVPAFGATATGKRIKLGAAGALSPPTTILYFAAFFGAAAELTDGQIQTLGSVLGWTLP